MKNRDNNSRNLLEWAKYYAAKGFSVIPLQPNSKKALIKWKKYQKNKPTAEELERWFQDGRVNIGIVTGEISGITVIDLDSEEAMAFAGEHEFPNAPKVETSKGCHLYYVYKKGVRSFQNRGDLPKIDLRSDGGYVVAPPSIHPDGRRYKWVEGCGLDDLSFPDLPKLITTQKAPGKKPISDLLKGVPEGQRNNSLARIVGYWIRQGQSYDDCLQKALEWNERNHPPMSKEEIEITVQSIYKKHQRQNEMFNIEKIAEDTHTVFIFDREEDSETFNSLGIKGYCGRSMMPKKGVNFEELEGKKVVIYQANHSEARRRVSDLAKNIYIRGHAKNVEAFESPIKQNFLVLFANFFPEGLKSLQRLNCAGLSKREKINLGLGKTCLTNLIFSEGRIRSKVPSQDIVKGPFDELEFFESPKMLMSPWLDEETLVLVASATGVGKTWFLLEIADACAKGRDAFNGLWTANTPVKVLYVDGEMSTGKWGRRMKVIKPGDNFEYISKRQWEKKRLNPPLNLDNAESRACLTRLIEEKDSKLVIFDNIISLTSDYNKIGDENWGPVNNWLLNLRANKIAVMLAHHTGKGEKADQLGTVTRITNLDVSLILKPKARPGEAQKLCAFSINVQKDRDGVITGLINKVFRFENGNWNVEETRKNKKIDQSGKKDLEQLKIACQLFVEGTKQKDIASKIGVGDSAISRRIKPTLLGEKDQEAWMKQVKGRFELTNFGKEQIG